MSKETTTFQAESIQVFHTIFTFALVTMDLSLINGSTKKRSAALGFAMT